MQNSYAAVRLICYRTGEASGQRICVSSTVDVASGQIAERLIVDRLTDADRRRLSTLHRRPVKSYRWSVSGGEAGVNQACRPDICLSHAIATRRNTWFNY